MVFVCLSCAGCQRAPSVDILGSYFPGWLLCIATALVLTVLVRSLLLRFRIAVIAPSLVYPSLLACFTFAQWLLFLR